MLALADAVRRWHEAQRPADVGLEIEPGVELERRWVPLDSVGIYVPRGLVSTLVMCAVPALRRRRRADRRRDAARRRGPVAAAAAAARARRGVGARRAAGDRLARVRPRASTRSSAPATRPSTRRSCSSRATSRSTCPPARRRWSSSPDAAPTARIVELELAAQAEHGPDSVCRVIEADGDRRAALARGRGGSRPSTSSCSARRRRSPAAVRNAGAVFVGAVRRRRGGRLRDRRQPRPADRRLGALDRRARDRDVPEAGDDAAADRGRARRAAPDRRGARGGRGHAGARGGGAAVRALSPRSGPTSGRRRPRDLARAPGSTRSRSSASTATSRAAPARRRGPGRSPARSPA